MATFLAVAAPGCSTTLAGRSAGRVRPFELEETTLADMRRGMATGRFTAAGLAKTYLRRIDEVDRNGPRLNSVIELNPDAPVLAAELDRERKAKGPRGPLLLPL